MIPLSIPITWLRRIVRSCKGPPLEGEDHWEDVGSNQFQFLISEGLQPHHYLLDVACGSFRGGQHFIQYLERGHYFGFDRAADNLRAGIRRVLKPSGLLKKQPSISELALTDTPQDYGRLLHWSSFDYVWIHAVFDHVPHDVIRQSLKDLARVLVPNGRLYATIFLNPHGPAYHEPILRLRNGSRDRAVVTYPDREYWHHTTQFFEEAVADVPGLRFDACLSQYPHPLGLQVVRLIRES